MIVVGDDGIAAGEISTDVNEQTDSGTSFESRMKPRALKCQHFFLLRMIL